MIILELARGMHLLFSLYAVSHIVPLYHLPSGSGCLSSHCPDKARDARLLAEDRSPAECLGAGSGTGAGAGVDARAGQSRGSASYVQHCCGEQDQAHEGHGHQVQPSNGTVIGFDPLQAPRPSLHASLGFISQNSPEMAQDRPKHNFRSTRFVNISPHTSVTMLRRVSAGSKATRQLPTHGTPLRGLGNDPKPLSKGRSQRQSVSPPDTASIAGH